MLQFPVKIDWMTFSGKAKVSDFDGGSLSRLSTLRFGKAELEALTGETCDLEMTKNNGFYPYCFQDSLSGALVQISDKPEDQGYLIIFPGTVCFGGERRCEILSNAAARGLRTTRLDVALDIIQRGITVAQVAAEYDLTPHDGRKKKTQFIKSPGGDTFYIGSRASAHYLRVYDKGKQQGIEGNWIRCEIELKDYAAPHWVNLVMYNPADACVEMRRMIDTPGTELDKILEYVTANKEHTKASAPYAAGDDEIWFRTAVMPAFRRIALENPALALRIYQGFRGYFDDGAPSMQVLVDLVE